MIIALVILLSLVGFIMIKLDKDEGAVYFIGLALFIVGLAACVGMIMAHGAIFISANGTAAALQAKYDTLMYQVDYYFYKDEIISISMRDFMKDIIEWNEELAENKANMHNIWIGIFYPKIYDQFNFIIL